MSDLSELKKCRRLAAYLRLLENTTVFIGLHRRVREAASAPNPADREARALHADALKQWESAIGHNLMTLVNEWPIENTFWDNEYED